MLAAQLNDFHGRISRCAQRCQDSAQDSLRSDASQDDADRAQVRIRMHRCHVLYADGSCILSPSCSFPYRALLPTG